MLHVLDMWAVLTKSPLLGTPLSAAHQHLMLLNDQHSLDPGQSSHNSTGTAEELVGPGSAPGQQCSAGCWLWRLKAITAQSGSFLPARCRHKELLQVQLRYQPRQRGRADSTWKIAFTSSGWMLRTFICLYCCPLCHKVIRAQSV